MEVFMYNMIQVSKDLFGAALSGKRKFGKFRKAEELTQFHEE
jgi:hypothetical protein